MTSCSREGCPVVIGLGIDENFVASDVAALLPVTRRFMFLDEGDVAEIRRRSIRIVDSEGRAVQRETRVSESPADAVERGQYRHFMLKEYTNSRGRLRRRSRSVSQVDACWRRSLRRRPCSIGSKSVHMAACGRSYHAGLAACYFLEQICRIPARSNSRLISLPKCGRDSQHAVRDDFSIR